MSEYSLLARSLCVRRQNLRLPVRPDAGNSCEVAASPHWRVAQTPRLVLQTSVSPSAQLHPLLREQAHVCSFSSLLWENENSCISWLHKDGWRILLLVVVKCSMFQYLCVLPPSDPGDYLPPALADDIQPPLFSWYTVRGRGANSLFKCLSAWTNT